MLNGVRFLLFAVMVVYGVHQRFWDSNGRILTGNVPVLLFVPPRQSITLAEVSDKFQFSQSYIRTYGTVLNRLRKARFILLADIEIPASIYELSFAVL